MARSIRAGTAHRASGELALRVLDTMEAVARSITAGTFERIPTMFDSPDVLPADWDQCVVTID